MKEENTASTLLSLLRDGSLYHRAPPHLRARVIAALPDPPRRAPWPAWRRLAFADPWAWAGGGMAGIVASLMVMGLIGVIQPQRSDALGEDVLSSHVRALLSQHAIDVVSTDRHTVKPWFNGRLDYAPPVIDLAAQGFPLAGGRIDYIDHRTVAVLIYRDQQHPIDLYVVPASSATAGTTAPTAYSADGYAIVRWQQNGMRFWAITDAEPAHLSRFVQALRAEAGKP